MATRNGITRLLRECTEAAIREGRVTIDAIAEAALKTYPAEFEAEAHHLMMKGMRVTIRQCLREMEDTETEQPLLPGTASVPRAIAVPTHSEDGDGFYWVHILNAKVTEIEANIAMKKAGVARDTARIERLEEFLDQVRTWMNGEANASVREALDKIAAADRLLRS